MTEQHKINCIIIDDNDIDREAIVQKARQSACLRIAGMYANPIEALDQLRTSEDLLLLLDVDMPGMSGIDLIKLIRSDNIACILVTAHTEYAVAAYENHILDYLLKPVTASRFEASIDRARQYFQVRKKAALYDMQVSNENLTIKDGYDTVRLNLGDIVYLEALKDYTKVITVARTYITSINLKESLTKLPIDRFLRIHRSYAVAVRQIRKMEQNELLLEHVRLPVGKTFRQDVSRFLKKNA